MGIINDLLRELGLPRLGGSKRGTKSSILPEPKEIKEQVEKVVGDLNELKDLPKAIMDGAMEAEEDFREADKVFRGTRFKGKRKS